MLLEPRLRVEEAFNAHFALVRRILQESAYIASQFILPLLTVFCGGYERRERERRDRERGDYRLKRQGRTRNKARASIACEKKVETLINPRTKGGNKFKKAKGISIMVTYFVVNGRVIAHDVVLLFAGIRLQCGPIFSCKKAN